MGRVRVLIAGIVAGTVALATVGPLTATAGAAAREAGPPRALLVGDSITWSYQDEVATELRARGYEVMVDAVPGSGLRDEGSCYGKRAKRLRFWDPDVVVYQSIGAYGMRPPCAATPGGTPRFFRQWRREAETVQRVLTRRGARFLWILNPQTEPPWPVDSFNAIYRDVADVADREIELVDAWSAFGGAVYNPDLHVSDGVHLNRAGERLLADLILAKVG